MGFAPSGPDQVQDDDGNTYFAPYLPPAAGNYGPPLEPPAPPPVPQDPYATPDSPLKNFPATPPATPQQAKDALMTNDVGAFSSVGGTPQGDSDMAKIMAGKAKHEAETARASSDAQKDINAATLKKDVIQAGTIMQTADEYEAHAAKIRNDAKGRWDDWNKRNKENASRLVDAKAAFNNPATAGHINWALMFIGAGLMGGNAVGQAVQLMNQLVETDIGIQKTNISNERKGLDEERVALNEQDKLGKDAFADWYSAKNLRLSAVGKQLDVQIAQVGMKAAEKMGLLKARDAIEAELVKGQQHMADHFFTSGERKASESHDVYMERLKSKLRMSEDVFKESLKPDKQHTLPTGTGLGLQMVDKNTGKAVESGQIPLLNGLEPTKVVEAGNIFSSANEEASQLKAIDEMLNGMSSTDLARGGTPKFKSMVKDVMQARAVRDNGHRISDQDVPRAAQEEFGVRMEDSLAKNAIDANRQVGPYKKGVQEAIKHQLRNLSSKTTNKLLPYLDAKAAQQYEVQFNPQNTQVPEPDSEADDLNTEILKAAGGENVDDLLIPGPRPPVNKDAAVEGDLAQYQAERTKGRGAGGGLPLLPVNDEDKVNQAVAAFSHATPDDILKLSQSYLRSKKLSEEAKHEIRLEAQDALVDSRKRNDAAIEAVIDRYQASHHVENPAGGDPYSDSGTGFIPAPVKDESGNYTKEFQYYMDSGLLDEMRRRAGLVPRKPRKH